MIESVLHRCGHSTRDCPDAPALPHSALRCPRCCARRPRRPWSRRVGNGEIRASPRPGQAPGSWHGVNPLAQPSSAQPPDQQRCQQHCTQTAPRTTRFLFTPFPAFHPSLQRSMLRRVREFEVKAQRYLASGWKPLSFQRGHGFAQHFRYFPHHPPDLVELIAMHVGQQSPDELGFRMVTPGIVTPGAHRVEVPLRVVEDHLDPTDGREYFRSGSFSAHEVVQMRTLVTQTPVKVMVTPHVVVYGVHQVGRRRNGTAGRLPSFGPFGKLLQQAFGSFAKSTKRR